MIYGDTHMQMPTQTLTLSQDTSPRRGIFWLIAYVIVLMLGVLVLVSAVTSAPVIWNAEASLGHPLTCHEAYQERGISGALYEQHRAAGDILWLFAAFFPVLGLMFAAASFGLWQRTFLSTRTRALMLTVGLSIITVLVLYQHPIRMIACAIE